MTIKTVVDGLKYRLNGGAASDDRRLSDKYLEHVIVSARNTLLRQKKDKKQEIPEYLYTYLCTDVVDSPFHNCNCEEGFCIYKATTLSIPSFIDLQVLNLNGEAINEMCIDTHKYKLKHAKTGKGGMNYEYKNGKIFLYNALPQLKKIMIKGIFSEEIKAMESCPTSSTTSGTCVMKASTLFIDDLYIKELYDIAESIVYGRMKQNINDNSTNKKDDTQMSI